MFFSDICSDICSDNYEDCGTAHISFRYVKKINFSFCEIITEVSLWSFSFTCRKSTGNVSENLNFDDYSIPLPFPLIESRQDQYICPINKFLTFKIYSNIFIFSSIVVFRREGHGGLLGKTVKTGKISCSLMPKSSIEQYIKLYSSIEKYRAI